MEIGNTIKQKKKGMLKYSFAQGDNRLVIINKPRRDILNLFVVSAAFTIFCYKRLFPDNRRVY